MQGYTRMILIIGLTWMHLLIIGALLAIDIIHPAFVTQEVSQTLKIGIGVLFVLMIIALSVVIHEIRVVHRTDNERLRELFALLSDGIIVMDPYRIITIINPAAERLTGWQLTDVIPYCLFCQKRDVHVGEERCLLAAEPHRNYFESKLPKKMGGTVDVGMSRSFLSPNRKTNERDMVITIRDVSMAKQEEELRLSRRLTHHTLEVQEEERKRLSQELHDGISQTLYGISLGMEHLVRRIDEPAISSRMEQLQQQVYSCIEEIRLLSRTLYPAVLYDIGLLSALRSMTERLSTRRTHVVFMTDLVSESVIAPSISVHIYRIVQEAVHNAIQHGEATTITITLSNGPKNLLLRIEDDGNGFDQYRQYGEGYGLRNMEERSRAIGGIFQMKSLLGQGTTIEVTVPKDQMIENFT